MIVPRPAGPGTGFPAGAGQVGVVLSTPDGISDANGAFLRMTGFTRQELSDGQAHWRAITAPEWTELDDDAVAELSATGSYGPHRKEYRRRDGARLAVEVAGVLLGEDPMTWVTFVRDMTVPQAGAAPLPDSAERLAALAADLARAVTVEGSGPDPHRSPAPVDGRHGGHHHGSASRWSGHAVAAAGRAPAADRAGVRGVPGTLDAPATRAWRGRKLIFYPDRAALEREYPQDEAARTPIGWTVRNGEPLMLTSAAEIAARFPHAAFTHVATGSSSSLRSSRTPARKLRRPGAGTGPAV